VHAVESFYHAYLYIACNLVLVNGSATPLARSELDILSRDPLAEMRDVPANAVGASGSGLSWDFVADGYDSPDEDRRKRNEASGLQEPRKQRTLMGSAVSAALRAGDPGLAAATTRSEYELQRLWSKFQIGEPMLVRDDRCLSCQFVVGVDRLVVLVCILSCVE